MVMQSAPRMRGETLLVQGAADPLIEARERAAELTESATASRIEVELLDGANHYFDQRHDALAHSIVAWLGRTSPGAA
jgi:alpha-beta hydrolase superfamily lysophospholipase